jgi:predicted Fe-Mo cluster-binding NifX family protein
MKIAVSSTGPDLDSEIDPRFGRCRYFIIIDQETMKFEAVQNPHVLTTGGAGIQSAQLVANKGAEVILAGNCGPNAFQTLSAAGIKVIVGALGTVREAIERYKRGELQPATQPSVAGG